MLEIYQSESGKLKLHKEITKTRKDPTKPNVTKGSMMWQFVSDALLTGRYGENLQTIKRIGDKWIFAVRAVNQKAFQPHQVLLKDQSWALFLDYGQLKGRKKPESSEDYTRLRSNFFNAIVRCACDGVITKLDRNSAAQFGITLFKDYKYFVYEGNRPPHRLAKRLCLADMGTSTTNNAANINDFAAADVDALALSPGEYLFSVKMGENGVIEATKFLGVLPDDFNLTPFIQETEDNSQLNDAPVVNMVDSDSSESSCTSESSSDEINSSKNGPKNHRPKDSSQPVIKVEPVDIADDSSCGESDHSNTLQIDYVSVSHATGEIVSRNGFTTVSDSLQSELHCNNELHRPEISAMEIDQSTRDAAQSFVEFCKYIKQEEESELIIS